MRRWISKKILNEAKRLCQLTSQSLKNKCWVDYERYLSSYNQLLRKAYQHAVCRELFPISPVPKRDRGLLYSPSPAEKAKLVEITQKSLQVYKTLKDACHRSSLAELNKNTASGVLRVQRICERFHLLVTCLQYKYHKKRTFAVNNEYDVQYLFRALLLLDFDDIRTEEWTPSYAGGSARMDFLILPYKIIVETKMTRKGLGDRKIGEELIIDLERYQEHPKCKILYCFVYDPDKRIKNPRGLEEDIERRSTKNLMVKVTVCPYGT